MEIASFVFNDFQENTYILWDETRACVIIDPGCFRREEQLELVSFIDSNQLKPLHLLNTHCHIDHILGNAFVSEKYQLPLQLHQDELITYRQTSQWAVMFGIPEQKPPENLVFLTEGDTVRFGKSELSVISIPGHSIASIGFVAKDSGFVVAGDVLFYESIGRTDLPNGNYQTLISSIHSKLLIMDDSTLVYPGHGPKTTIGHERRFNPFINA